GIDDQRLAFLRIRHIGVVEWHVLVLVAVLRPEFEVALALGKGEPDRLLVREMRGPGDASDATLPHFNLAGWPQHPAIVLIDGKAGRLALDRAGRIFVLPDRHRTAVHPTDLVAMLIAGKRQAARAVRPDIEARLALAVADTGDADLWMNLV